MTKTSFLIHLLMKIKRKINKWDLIKSFHTAKETINKMKRQPTERERIFATEATERGLISKVYEQLYVRKTNNPINKRAKYLNIYFSKEDIQMPRTHEKMFNITNYQRNGNQTTVLTTVRMVIIKKPTKKKMLETVWRKGNFSILLEGIHGHKHYRK